MFRRMILTAVLAIAPVTPLPALADGTLTLSLTPRDAREAAALRLGLGLYALHRHLDQGGTLRQFGQDNAAMLRQQGGGNWGLIDQRGSGHTGTLEQTGGGNAHALFQSGKGTRAAVTQTGGQVGITFLHGF